MTTTVASRPGAPPQPGAPSCLPAILLDRAREHPGRVAVRQKRYGVWEELAWSAYAERVARVGLGLRARGVEPGDRVAVLGDNRLEWALADLGAQGVGAVTVGVYPTSPAPEVEYLLAHSESVVIVVEDEEQLDKVLEVRDRLPRLRHIVVIDPRGVGHLSDPAVTTLSELEAAGSERRLDEFADAAAAIDASDVAIIVYTSGTTGPPKGAMLSHANLLAAGEAGRRAFGLGPGDEVLSYLPLCHIAERLFSIVDPVAGGYVVNFGDDPESFAADLRDVQPTFFLGVPRVWEKMLAGVEMRVADASRAKRLLYRFWVRRGQRLAAKRMQERLGPMGWAAYALGWLVVYRSLRQKLGLRRVRVALSGAAPIAPQVLEYFWSIGVPIREGYGQTENTAICTVNPPHDVRIGTVGTALDDVELRVDEGGEILVRCPGVFVGYFEDETATKAAVDPDGWLHTGDVGELDADGYLTITDRKKDIVITAGGKNVAPAYIENMLKVSPWIREAVVVGDRRPYLVALVGIEADTVGDWCTRRNIAYTTYSDLSGRPEVRELVTEVVDEVNRGLARVEQIKGFELLPVELDHEDGQLTATQKVKRAAIAQQFGELIEGLYR